MKTKTSAPCPRVSDSLVLGLALEFAFVISSQILVMRPTLRTGLQRVCGDPLALCTIIVQLGQ